MPVSNIDSLNLYVVHNEVNPACTFHCDALAAQFPTAEEVDFVAGERVPLEEADGVILTGSTAGVYEAARRPWIAEQEALVRELVDREIPTLGVCFGHQIVNVALGGTVEAGELTAKRVEATLAADPLFDGVEPVVVALHGDVVTKPGTNMEVIASADHAHVFGTRHQHAPLWTVQFHPEITAEHREHLEEFGWDDAHFSFGAVTAARVFENFANYIRNSELAASNS